MQAQMNHLSRWKETQHCISSLQSRRQATWRISSCIQMLDLQTHSFCQHGVSCRCDSPVWSASTDVQVADDMPQIHWTWIVCEVRLGLCDTWIGGTLPDDASCLKGIPLFHLRESTVQGVFPCTLVSYHLQIVMSTGNPRVIFGWPLPLPFKTGDPTYGYRYLAGMGTGFMRVGWV